MKRSPKAVIGVSVILIFVPACATHHAQQSINTWNEQITAIVNATESAHRKLIERCTTSENGLREVLNAQSVPSNARHVVEYIKVIAPVKEYMEMNHVTMEQALVAVGDVPMPFETHEESDPFNGCLIKPGMPYNKPMHERSSGQSTDDWVFRWSPKDADSIVSAIIEKSLPETERLAELRWLIRAMQSLSDALDTRAARGEIKLLQYIRATNVAIKNLRGQAVQLRMQLQRNLDLAKAQDQATIQAIAAGLAAATAAMAATSPAGYQGSPDSYQQQQLDLQRQQLQVQQDLLQQQQQAEFQRQSEERQRRTQRFEECMRNSSSGNPRFCSP